MADFSENRLGCRGPSGIRRIKMVSTDLWELKFGIEVSARYHEWRRDTMESNGRKTRAATFAGAIAILLTALSSSELWAIVSLAIIIALVNLWELIAGWPKAACVHADLYRRFAELRRRWSTWSTLILCKSPNGHLRRAGSDAMSHPQCGPYMLCAGTRRSLDMRRSRKDTTAISSGGSKRSQMCCILRRKLSRP